MYFKTEIKKSISTAFKEGEFFIAFDLLLSLPHHEVVNLEQKNKWLQTIVISNFFWKVFCIQRFDFTFQSKAAESVLNWYLKDLNQTNNELNNLLVQRNPCAFIKAIKRNRSFLDNTFVKQIAKNDWSIEFSTDLIVFNELRKQHVLLQDKIEIAWKEIEGLKTEAILSGVIHWVDLRFYKEYSDLNHEKLRCVYNYAVSFIFSKKSNDDYVSEEKFSEVFYNTVQSLQLDSFALFLNSLQDWITFETTILSSYCFDENFQVTCKDGLLQFNFNSNEVYETWKEDTERYLVNSKRYLVEAMQIYDYQDELGELNIPSNESKIIENINHGLYIKNWQSVLFLDDLHLINLKFRGRTVSCSKLLGGLMSFSINRQWRYVERMKEFTSIGYEWSYSLYLTMQLAQKEDVENSPIPYIYESLKNITSLYQHAIPDFKEDEIQDLINHFSYTLKSGREINPFHIGYSIAETPFIKIGEYVLAPTSLFASNDWFFSFAQRILTLYANKHHLKERNETVDKMEIELGEKFEKHGWTVKIISKQESNQIDGDIDLFVNDGKSQLLIQLKRTIFKLDLASDYKDSLETDLKASGQLNGAMSYLDSNPLPGMYILKNHEKWIVTTSFERMLTRVDGCIKVNYFDLLWALKHKKYTSLDELKIYIESDGPFIDCRFYLDVFN